MDTRIGKNTFRGLGDANRLVVRRHFVKLSDFGTISGKFPMIRKKFFDNCVVNPPKPGSCKYFYQSAVGTCENCEKLIDQHKEIEQTIFHLKRKPPEGKGNSLTYCHF